MKKFLVLISVIIVLIVGIMGFKIHNTRNTVAIIGAMDTEIENIKQNLTNSKIYTKNNYTITAGKLNNKNLIILKSGIGKANAAMTTQFVIDKYKPKYIINTGIAGGIDNKLKVGDIILADQLVQHDFDISVFGHSKGYMGTGKDHKKPTFYNSSTTLIKQSKRKIKKLYPDKSIYVGTIASGDIFVTSQKQKKSIRTEFKALAVDMESAAIAQTANRNNVPVLIMRLISDGNKNNEQGYLGNKQNISELSAEITINILK